MGVAYQNEIEAGIRRVKEERMTRTVSMNRPIFTNGWLSIFWMTMHQPELVDWAYENKEKTDGHKAHR
jgi:hypothetical protein